MVIAVGLGVIGISMSQCSAYCVIVVGMAVIPEGHILVGLVVLEVG